MVHVRGLKPRIKVAGAGPVLCIIRHQMGESTVEYDRGSLDSEFMYNGVVTGPEPALSTDSHNESWDDLNYTAMTMFATITTTSTSLSASGFNLTYFLVPDVIIALLTCFGNILLLVAYATSSRLRRRNQFLWVLVVNLAVSDLFHGAVAVPFFVIPHYAAPQLKSASRVVCVLSFVVFQFSTSVSLLTTLAIAVERYLAVAAPFWRPPGCLRRIANRRLVLVALWLYPALGLSTMAAWHTVGQTWTLCEMSVVLPRAFLVLIGVHLFVVLVVAGTLYAKILCATRSSRKSVRRATINNSSAPSDQGKTIVRQTNLPGNGNRSSPDKDMLCSSNDEVPASKSNIVVTDQNVRKATKPSGVNREESVHCTTNHDIRLVKTLVLLMVIFYCCFLPTFLKVVIAVIQGHPSPEPLWVNIYDQIALGFLMLAPCLDPFIYSWRNQGLRRTVRGLLLRPCRTQGQTDTGTSRATQSSHRVKVPPAETQCIATRL